MVQPTHDPDRVITLRVTPAIRDRLSRLVASSATGAAKLSRHSLAVWCLERGLVAAEEDPTAILRPPAPLAAPPAAEADTELEAHMRVLLRTATSREIADRADVAQSTVSKAARGGSVRPQVRAALMALR